MKITNYLKNYEKNNAFRILESKDYIIDQFLLYLQHFTSVIYKFYIIMIYILNNRVFFLKTIRFPEDSYLNL